MEGIFLHLNIYNVSNPDSFKYINKKMHKPENNNKKFLQPFLTAVLRIRVILMNFDPNLNFDGSES